MWSRNVRFVNLHLLMFVTLTGCTVPNPTHRKPIDAGEDTTGDGATADGGPPACLVTQTPSCANSDAYDLFTVDVSGDGKADLIAKQKSPPGNWYVAINTGSVFQPQPSPWLTGWAMASDDFDYFAVDLNGDRKADLIAKDRKAPGDWHVALNTGFAFQPQLLPWMTGWASLSDAFNYFAVDVNGDGKSDLIAKDKAPPGGWHVAINTGAAFQPQVSQWLTDWATVSEPYDLFAVDLNNDRRSDLIAKEKNPPGNWYVAINNGSAFQPQLSRWGTDWATPSGPYNIFSVDLNGDGQSDLIAKQKNLPGHWYVAINNGSAFEAKADPWLTGWATPSGANDLFVADVNGDGKMDLIAKEKTPAGSWSVAIASGDAFVPQSQPL